METKTFHTTDSAWAILNGSAVEVLGPLDEDKYDRADVGPMFEIRFPDGTVAQAYEDELQ